MDITATSELIKYLLLSPTEGRQLKGKERKEPSSARCWAPTGEQESWRRGIF